MTICEASQHWSVGALSTDYILITGAEFPGSNRSHAMNFDDAHTAATNAANELEALQGTDFWLELPGDIQVELCKSHAILRTMVGTMEAADLV
jgi:hypothetical protein